MYVTELKSLLLDKYKHIIGDCDKEELSIDGIVDLVVHYYESIIACMPGNVYWLDTQGNALGANDNVLQMFGLKYLHEFKGLSFEEMGKIGNHSLEAIQSFKNDSLEVVKTGKAKLGIEEPIIPHLGNGNLIYFLTSRVPLFNPSGEVVGVVGISFDITDRKLKEQALLEAKTQADIANKAKTEFLSNMRHDIRTPLSGIVGVAELLNNETNPEKIKTFTKCLTDSSKELLRFLNEILESINISSGEIPILNKSFNLKKILCNVIDFNRSKILEKKLDLEFIFDQNIPEYLIGDPMRIYRIVLELIGNALKFTDQGYIKIHIKLSKQDGLNYVINIEVTDTGCGIQTEKQQEIFLQFTRLAPSYDGVYKGYGLGLFIAKKFIDDLNGAIYITSNLNEGSKFNCVLPMQIDLNNGMEYTKTEPMVDYEFFDNSHILNSSDFDNITLVNKILIVEDQIQASMVLQNMLHDFGFAVDIAQDGKTALDLFKNNQYDLIFMDIGLPDLSGYDVTKQIRSRESLATQKVPIIALTAHVNAEEKQKCLERAVNAVFTKPIFKEKLLKIFKVFFPKYIQTKSKLTEQA